MFSRCLGASVVKSTKRELVMPHVQITMLAGRSVEQKRRAAQRITEVMREELEVNPAKLSIAFVEVPRESYASNGVLVADKSESQS